MSLIARRLVLAAGPTPYPDRPPRDVQAVVPVALPSGAAPRAGTPDFYDLIDGGHSDTQGLTVLYEAERYDDGTFSVKRDVFGPADFPHTFAGWPIPGDPKLPPELVPTP